MTILYHFTCVENAYPIFKSKILRKGAIANATGLEYDKAVCLTADPNPDGHGLPDGREITEEQSKNFVYRRERNGRLYTVNHTAIRLSVDIPSGDPKLVSAAEHYAGQLKVLQALEIAAFFPVGEKISNDDLARTQRALKAGELLGKAATWWLYYGDIPLSNVVAVGIKESSGHYLMGSPESFASQMI